VASAQQEGIECYRSGVSTAGNAWRIVADTPEECKDASQVVIRAMQQVALPDREFIAYDAVQWAADADGRCGRIVYFAAYGVDRDGAEALRLQVGIAANEHLESSGSAYRL
jgi:hypothetical protein